MIYNFLKAKRFLGSPYAYDFSNFSLTLCLHKIIESVAMVINQLQRQRGSTCIHQSKILEAAIQMCSLNTIIR